MARQLKITAFFNSPASETSPELSACKQMQEHPANPKDSDADSEDSGPAQRPRKSSRPHLEILDSSPEVGKTDEQTPKRRRIRRISSSSESSRAPSPAAPSSEPSSQAPLADGIIGMKVRSPTSNNSA